MESDPQILWDGLLESRVHSVWPCFREHEASYPNEKNRVTFLGTGLRVKARFSLFLDGWMVPTGTKKKGKQMRRMRKFTESKGKRRKTDTESQWHAHPGPLSLLWKVVAPWAWEGNSLHFKSSRILCLAFRRFLNKITLSTKINSQKVHAKF